MSYSLRMGSARSSLLMLQALALGGCGGAPTQGVVEATLGMFVGITGVGGLRGGKTAPFFSGRGSVGPVPEPTNFLYQEI